MRFFYDYALSFIAQKSCFSSKYPLIKIIFYLTAKSSLPRAQSGSVLWPVLASHAMFYRHRVSGLSRNVTRQKSARFLEILYRVTQPLPCARVSSQRSAIFKSRRGEGPGARLVISCPTTEHWKFVFYITKEHSYHSLPCPELVFHAQSISCDSSSLSDFENTTPEMLWTGLQIIT